MIRPTDVAVRSTATSRSAASGATRDARTAGASEANRVTASPTSGAMTRVAVLIVSPPAGRANPKALNSALMPWASPRPAARPTTDATTPTSRASPIIVASTWRRSAPTARSSADER